MLNQPMKLLLVESPAHSIESIQHNGMYQKEWTSDSIKSYMIEKTEK